MQKNKTVVVFFGGDSYEREVSVITGVFCANLLKERYRVIPVYLDKDNGFSTSDRFFSLSAFGKEIEGKRVAFAFGEMFVFGKSFKRGEKIYAALNCCHGGAGEDGSLAGYCALCGIPFASPPVPSSAIFMDKVYTKYLARSLGIPTLKFFVSRREEDMENLSFPFVCKPARLGSSIGIQKVDSGEEWKQKISSALAFDDKVLVEEYLLNKREATCAAYRKGDEIVVSPAVESFAGEEIYSFAEKYDPAQKRGRTEISGAVGERIREYTRTLYAQTDCTGLVRADFFIAGEEVYFNEMNTVPGSLGYGLFTERLTEQREILCDLVEQARLLPQRQKAQFMADILNKKEYSGSTSCKF